MSCPTALSMPHRLLLWLLVATATPAGAAVERGANYGAFPRPDAGYVTDLAHVLDGAQEERIERWLWQVEKQTSVEICVVIINSLGDYPDTPNGSIEPFATALFNRWGIGNQPHNDGILLLICIQDRKARIELGAGHGHARDAAARRIMDGSILPRFGKGDYPGGIEQGVRAIMLEYAGVRVGWNWSLLLSIAAVPVLALVAISLFRHGKRGWGWVAVGAIVVLLLVIVYLIRRANQLLPDRDSSSWSPGGFGGGFGGGFSGGGGATGSW